MAESKRQNELKELEKLAKYYRKFTIEQLRMFKNSSAKSPDKRLVKAVNEELKARGIDYKEL